MLTSFLPLSFSHFLPSFPPSSLPSPLPCLIHSHLRKSITKQSAKKAPQMYQKQPQISFRYHTKNIVSHRKTPPAQFGAQATASKEGSRSANYPILIQGGSMGHLVLVNNRLPSRWIWWHGGLRYTWCTGYFICTHGKSLWATQTTNLHLQKPVKISIRLSWCTGLEIEYRWLRPFPVRIPSLRLVNWMTMGTIVSKRLPHP